MRASLMWGLGVAMVTAAALPMAVQGQAPPPLPQGVTQQMVDQGRQVYTTQGNCATCHGAEGKGSAFAPDLTDGEWLNIDGTFDSIVKAINDGVLQPKKSAIPMAPRGGANINDDQVRAVSAYVWRLANGS